jgi:hypothetical protein
MADRILFHAGFHKSGTTALQYSFDKNRKALKSRGVTYLVTTGRAHHRPAWSLTERIWGWKEQGGERIPATVWRDFAKRVKKSPGIALISSEFFSEADADQIAKVKRDLGSTPVEVVFTVRPFAKILASSYQQFLKYGIKLRYEEWLDEMFHHRGTSKHTPTFWQRAAVGEVVAKWAQIFGAANVSVLLANEEQPNFIFDEFNRLLGVGDGFLKPTDIGGNRSMTADEVELLWRVNNRFDRARGWNEYRAMIREGYVHHLADETQALPGSSRLLTPKWAVDEAKKIGDSDLTRLKDLGVKISGDERSFLNPQVPEGSNDPIEAMNLDRVAEILLSYDLQAIERFPLTTIVQEVKRRIRRYLRRKRKGVL